MLSFLAPVAGEGLRFLRIFRTLRLGHTYYVVTRLKLEFALVRQPTKQGDIYVLDRRTSEPILPVRPVREVPRRYTWGGFTPG